MSWSKGKVKYGAYYDDLEMDEETPLIRAQNGKKPGFTYEADSIEKPRLMVLGCDDALMDKACATILGERENRDAFKFRPLIPRKASVGGRKVSVLKTPSYWLEHLKSYYIFSNGVKSITYEINHFVDIQLYPGPHAFLLVLKNMKNSGKEHYLLRALRDVFGKEILDFCMVIFLYEDRYSDPQRNKCLKKCKNRHHLLQNTDESVNQLLEKIDTMTQQKSSRFYTNYLESFRKAESYFREEFNAEYVERENKLRGEKETAEKKIKEMREQHTKKVTELNERIKDEQNGFKIREIQLKKELNALKIRENQLKKKLIDSKIKEDQSDKLLVTDDLYTTGNYEEQNEELVKRDKKLDERQRNLDARPKELKAGERKLTQRDAESSEHPQTTAETPSACNI
ncbi:uncharacterized protein isoform X2 [Danio rerio]|uniref:Uncharacterized protein isoform X2 n=1 Tax=Danio rerio TaxID=7955 RepID=A0AC58IC03_DANRE